MAKKNIIPEIIRGFSTERVPPRTTSMIKEYKDISLLTLVEQMENNLSNFDEPDKALFNKKLSDITKKIEKHKNDKDFKKEQDIEQAILKVEEIDDFDDNHPIHWFSAVLNVLSPQDKSKQKLTGLEIGDNESFILNDYMYRLVNSTLKKIAVGETDFSKSETANPSAIKQELLKELKKKLEEQQQNLRNKYRHLEKDKQLLFNVIVASYSKDFPELSNIFQDKFNKDCEMLEKTLNSLRPKPKVKKELPTSLELVFSDGGYIEKPNLHDKRAKLLEDIREILFFQEMDIAQFYEKLRTDSTKSKEATKVYNLYNNSIKKKLSTIKKQIEEFKEGGSAAIEVAGYMQEYNYIKKLKKQIYPDVQDENIDQDEINENNNSLNESKNYINVGDNYSQKAFELMMDEKNRKIDDLQTQLKGVNTQLNNAINNKNELLKTKENQLNKVKEEKDKEIKTLQEQVNQLKNEQKQQETTETISLVSGSLGATSTAGAVIGTAVGSSIAGLVLSIIAFVCLIVCVVALIAKSKSIGSVGSDGVSSQIKSISNDISVGEKLSLQEKNKQVIASKNKDKYLNNNNEQKKHITTTLKDKNNQIEANKTKSL